MRTPPRAGRVGAARVREYLHTAGYSAAEIAARIGIVYDTFNSTPASDALRYLDGQIGDGLDVLIRLLVFNQPLPSSIVRPVVPRDALDVLLVTGFVQHQQGNRLQSAFSLYECDGLLVATDSAVIDPPGINKVMPVFPESYDFLRIVSRAPVGAALDLCTGSGVHALAARRHSSVVIGTDISERAIEFARFNAWLNDMPDVRFIATDLYAAVRGQTFDLILANPPSLPTRDSESGESFYAGGRSGDAVTARVFASLAEHLRDDGLCQVVHRVYSVDATSPLEAIVAALGPLAPQCSVLTLSAPDPHAALYAAGAKTVEFASTHIQRHSVARDHARVHGPYQKRHVDVRALFAQLEDARSEGQRAAVLSGHGLGNSRCTFGTTG